MDLHIHITSFLQLFLWLLGISLLFTLVSPVARALSFFLVSAVEHFRYGIAALLLVGLVVVMGMCVNG